MQLQSSDATFTTTATQIAQRALFCWSGGGSDSSPGREQPITSPGL